MREIYKRNKLTTHVHPCDKRDKGLNSLKKSILRDSFSRNINYLRVSITDRCNLNCIYCRPDGTIPKLDHQEILRYEEILRIIRVSADLGVTKIRITGGEPLVRKGVFDFIEKVGDILQIKDISLTTNAVYLGEHLSKLQSTRIRRLNISLDSLDSDKFKKITGFDKFTQVWDAILKAHMLKFDPIKINVVVLAGINDNEIIDFAKLTKNYPFHIRFIEHMPIGSQQLFPEKPMLTSEIKERITSSFGGLLPVVKDIYDGPAERFRLKNAMGEIGFISPISHHFCQTCNRLRLTASGQLKPCLLSDYAEDLKTPIRQGCSDSDLAQIILRSVKNKPSQHHLSENTEHPMNMTMSSIGG